MDFVGRATMDKEYQIARERQNIMERDFGGHVITGVTSLGANYRFVLV